MATATEKFFPPLGADIAPVLSGRAAHRQSGNPEIASVLIDFDGTICPYDVTDLLLSRFASKEWENVENDWLSGKIGARECLSRQIGMLRVSPSDLDAFLAGVAIDTFFPSFISLMRGENIPVAIVSDGLDYSIRHILRNYKLSDIQIFSNHLAYCGGRDWRLEFPYKNPACPAGNCKCRHFNALPKKGAVVYIGDGASDFCPAAKADIVFAKGKLADFCRKQRINHIEVKNFTDILKLWPKLADLLPQMTGENAQAQVAL